MSFLWKKAEERQHGFLWHWGGCSNGVLACSLIWCLCRAPSVSITELRAVVPWWVISEVQYQLQGGKVVSSWQVRKSVSTFQIRKQQQSKKQCLYLAAIVVIPISPDLTGCMFCSIYSHSAALFHQGVVHYWDHSASSYAMPGDASTRRKVTFWEGCHFFFNTAKHPPICHKCLSSFPALQHLHITHSQRTAQHKGIYQISVINHMPVHITYKCQNHLLFAPHHQIWAFILSLS